MILFDFKSGIRGLWDANRLADHAAKDTRMTMGEMLIEGSDAALRLDGAGKLFIRFKGGVESTHPYDWRDRGFAGDSVFACQRHLVQCILERRTSPISGREYLRNLAIEEAVYESSHKGGIIEV